MSEVEFMGREGFTWWIGVIESRMDPLYLGRCKVRCLGWHTKDKSELPTEDLPWAMPLLPITSASQTQVGSSPTGPVEGTWVMGFFRDGEEAQDPVMLGTMGGIPTIASDPEEGFNDPRQYAPDPIIWDKDKKTFRKRVPADNDDFADVPQFPLTVTRDPIAGGVEIIERSDAPEELISDNPRKTEYPIQAKDFTYRYPLSRYLGEPTTPRLARGIVDPTSMTAPVIQPKSGGEVHANLKDPAGVLATKQDLRQSLGIRADTQKVKLLSFQEPISPYNAQYPYNHVHQSESGHAIEIDDTPGSERLHWYHRSGSYREMGPKGNIVD